MWHSIAYTIATEAGKFALNADKKWTEHLMTVDFVKKRGTVQLAQWLQKQTSLPSYADKSLGTHKSGLRSADDR